MPSDYFNQNKPNITQAHKKLILSNVLAQIYFATDRFKVTNTIADDVDRLTDSDIEHLKSMLDVISTDIARI